MKGMEDTAPALEDRGYTAKAMRTFTKDELQAATDALLKHYDRLAAINNGHYIGIGHEMTRNEPTGRLAIHVAVSKKLPIDEIDPAERLPEELEGFPVDVLDFSPVSVDSENEPPPARRNTEAAQIDPRAYQVPLKGGSQIFNITTKLGVFTYGLTIFDRATLRPYGLTNRHNIFQPGVDGKVGNDLCQPGGAPQVVIGKVSKENSELTDSLLIDLKRNLPQGISTQVLGMGVADLQGFATALGLGLRDGERDVLRERPGCFQRGRIQLADGLVEAEVDADAFLQAPLLVGEIFAYERP